jgi:hypothetical protein
VLCFCFVFLCTLCCPFLWIVNFWLPLRYSLTYIIRNRKCLPFPNTWLTPVFGGICVAHLFSFLCCVLVLFFFVLFLVPHVDCVPVHSWLSLLFPLTSIYFQVSHFQQIKFCIIFTRVCKVMKVYLCTVPHLESLNSNHHKTCLLSSFTIIPLCMGNFVKL